MHAGAASSDTRSSSPSPTPPDHPRHHSPLLARDNNRLEVAILVSTQYAIISLMHFDLTALIKSLGYIGVFAVVFAESGLLIGMFLPGDSLLFTAGFLASQGVLNFPILLIITFVAAVAGDSVGYFTGKRYGHKVFVKDNSLIFSTRHIKKSEAFYEKHGGKALILARFTPIVRTLAPILAGVGKMQYRTFLFFNFIGALIWAVGITSLGYFLGNAIPNVDTYILPALAVVVLVSLLPSVFHVARDAEQRANIRSAANRHLKRNKKPTTRS